MEKQATLKSFLVTAVLNHVGNLSWSDVSPENRAQI